MKNYLSIIAFLFLCTSLSAQTRIGLKTNITKFMAEKTNNYISTDNVSISYDVELSRFTTGVSFGFFTITEEEFCFIQTEALFSFYKTEYTVTSYVDELINNPFVEESNNFDLQVLAGIQHGDWRFGVGPVFHKSLDFNSDFGDYEFYKEEKRSMNFGFIGLVGYNIGPAHIDLKFENLFNKVGDHMIFSNRRAKFRTGITGISLGFGVGF